MRLVARIFAGPVMFLAGLNHFINPRFYISIMPDYLPAHEELVYASGVAEMVGALAVSHPRTRWWGRWFLIATLVAVYPANIYMAANPDRFQHIPHWALIARLPLQALFIFWAWLAGRDGQRKATTAGATVS